MSLQRKIIICTLSTLLFTWISGLNPLQADEGHMHHEETTEKKEKMDHHGKEKGMHHLHMPKKKAGPEFPEGTKEVVIDLSGPFCSRHPEEITSSLMKLEGVLHVEAFNSRDYILVHFNGDHVTPDVMATTIDGLKGSGWRCDGTVSTRRRTER